MSGLHWDVGAAKRNRLSLWCSVCPTISSAGRHLFPTLPPTPPSDSCRCGAVLVQPTQGKESQAKAEAWYLDRRRQTLQRHITFQRACLLSKRCLALLNASTTFQPFYLPCGPVLRISKNCCVPTCSLLKGLAAPCLISLLTSWKQSESIFLFLWILYVSPMLFLFLSNTKTLSAQQLTCSPDWKDTLLEDL